MLKSLSYYPVTLVGGVFLLIARVLGRFCLFGFLVTGILWLAGELEVSRWIVASLGGAGIGSLLFADLFTRFLVGLKLVNGNQWLCLPPSVLTDSFRRCRA